MLRIDVRELRQGPVETAGTIAPADPLLVGTSVELAEPLRVEGRLEATGRDDYVWHGHLSGRAAGVCRRCLTDLAVPIDLAVDAVFSANEDLLDDPSVYPIPDAAAEVDVSGAVREELLLALSQYPLCREDCAGLCSRCGADLNQGPCGCGPALR